MFLRFIGFYRNCYEKSVKQPQDKILSFLSSECICSFVEIINDLHNECESLNTQYITEFSFKSKIKVNKTSESIINDQAQSFFDSFTNWLKELNEKENLLSIDLEIKKLCLELVQKNKTNYLNSNKIYATIYFLLDDLFKPTEYFNDLNENKYYFIERIMKYNGINTSNKNEFKSFLSQIFNLNMKHKDAAHNYEINENLKNQLNFIIKQIKCSYNYNLLFVPRTISKMNKKKINFDHQNSRLELITNLIKCNWIYLVDVLTGFVLNTPLTQLEHVLFFESLESTSQKQVLQNENLSTDLSFELVAFKSCLDSLFQIISIISNFDSMDKELSQLIFLLEENCFIQNNFNSEFEINLNQLICLDFLFFASTQLVCNLDNNEIERKKKNYFFLNNYQILWNCMIETYFFITNLRLNIQENEESYSNEKISIFERAFKINKKNTNNNMISFRKKRFSHKSIYENLDLLLDKETDSIEVKISCQQELIIKNLFPFLNNEIYLLSKHQIFNKNDLTELIAFKMDYYLNEKLFKNMAEKPTDHETFDLIWIYSAQMCQFSKRFLQNKTFQTKHEYLNFNNLIIDKIDELLVKIIDKFSINNNSNVLPLASLPPVSTRNDQPFSFKPFSLYSIFITEIWIHIFIDYFQIVCGLLNQESNLQEEEYSMIDLSICKKIICIIQKSFETYLNITSCKKYIQLSTNSIERSDDLFKTSLSSSISSSSLSSNNLEEIDSLILDKDSQIFLSKFSSNNNLVDKTKVKTNDLLLNATTSIFLSQDGDFFKELCAIDENCHFNDLFILPFRNLMRKNKILDSHLQDTILVSLCELVETYSIQIKCWNSLFKCLNKVNLNNKKFILKNNKISSENSSLVSSYSSLSSLSSCSSNDSTNSLSSPAAAFNINVPFKFDSLRLRTSSLIDIFNIYLSLASNSAFILAQGSFDFIKCLANYLQYSPDIQIGSMDNDFYANEIVNQDDEDTTYQEIDIVDDEKCNEITSDYDHLCELSNSNETNTMIKPFLNCFEILFCILTNKLSNSSSLQPIYQIDGQMKNILLNPNILIFENFENNLEFNDLNEKMSIYLLQNDKKNIFKLFSFLIESISSRTCLGFDELNCVQMCLYLDSLLERLLDLNQFVLVGYCLLQIILKNLTVQIEYIENKNNMKILKKKLVNEKLFSNVLFLSNLMEKRIETCIRLLNKLIEKSEKNDLIILLINCNTSRLLNLVSKCLVTKLSKFDSVVEFNISEPFKQLYINCFKLNESTLSLKCIKSIELHHFISLKQMKQLINNYKEEENFQYLNLDVVASDHHTSAPWRLYNIKKTYSIAKEILFYKKESNKNCSEQNEENTLSNDEKNFYRDITLKFRDKKLSNIFAEQNHKENDQVNLTCFILAYKFHLDLIELISAILTNENNKLFLKLLNESHFISLKMDQIFSFKILISKIFFSNQENRLTNFVQLTKSTCLSILSSCLNKDEFKNNDYDDQETSETDLELKINESLDDINKYFYYFIQHLAGYYYFINEKVHNFKMEKSYFKGFLRENDLSSSDKVNKLFKFHQEHNKALMLSLTNSSNETNRFSTNELQDYKNRYQIWSCEMIGPFLLDFDNSNNIKNLNNGLFLDSMSTLIQLFNSCSRYCDCFAFDCDENVEKSKNASLNLMLNIIDILN